MAKYFLDREFYDMVRENEEVLHELDWIHLRKKLFFKQLSKRSIPSSSRISIIEIFDGSGCLNTTSDKDIGFVSGTKIDFKMMTNIFSIIFYWK